MRGFGVFYSLCFSGLMFWCQALWAAEYCEVTQDVFPAAEAAEVFKPPLREGILYGTAQSLRQDKAGILSLQGGLQLAYDNLQVFAGKGLVAVEKGDLELSDQVRLLDKVAGIELKAEQINVHLQQRRATATDVYYRVAAEDGATATDVHYRVAAEDGAVDVAPARGQAVDVAPARGQAADVAPARGQAADVVAPARGQAADVAPVRGQAASIELQQDTLHLTDATYTTCSGAVPAWQLRAKRVNAYPQSGYATIHHARLYVAGVPLLYLPWLAVPLGGKRRSGLLVPSIEQAGDEGWVYQLPLYLNIAPNMDATLTGSYHEDRGALLQLETRYLGQKLGFWQLTAAQINRDRLTDKRRWSRSLQHDGTPAPAWSSKIDYAKVSDAKFFDELGLSAFALTDDAFLNQRGHIQYQNENIDFRAEIYDFQILDQTLLPEHYPYRLKPRLKGSWSYPMNRHLQARLVGEYVQFTHNKHADVERWFSMPELRFSSPWSYGHVSAFVRLPNVEYDIAKGSVRPDVARNQPIGNGSNPAPDSSPSYAVAQSGVDATLFLNTPVTSLSQKWYLETALKLFYFYSDYEPQNDIPLLDTTVIDSNYDTLFSPQTFSSYDRIGDNNRLSLATTFQLMDVSSGHEVLYLALAQGYYFEERRIKLVDTPAAALKSPRSPLMAQLRWNLSPQWQTHLDVQWHEHIKSMRSLYLGWNFSSDDKHIINMGYYYQRRTLPATDDEEQGQMTLNLPLSSSWNLYAQRFYDFSREEVIEDLIGLEYNGCCWAVRLIFQRARQDDLSFRYSDRVRVEFKLLGLGGNDSGTLLKRKF